MFPGFLRVFWRRVGFSVARAPELDGYFPMRPKGDAFGYISIISLGQFRLFPIAFWAESLSVLGAWETKFAQYRSVCSNSGVAK